ncbi:MAG: sigma 54-interacting transcriptional regulator [Desulfovibrionaceae bacterium]|nr:sigma 54-interacting transcriptional regulator [Desulfovibrionaceae bacterium]
MSGGPMDELPLSALLDEAPVALALLDLGGRVVLVNRAYEALTGADRSGLAGLGCMHALRCDFCAKGCPVPEGRRAFSPVSHNGDIIARDRQRIPVRMTVALVPAADGAEAFFLETVQDMREVSELTRSGQAYSVKGFIGDSPKMRRVLDMIQSVAQTNSSVLITGETGTGKDLLAEAIHKASDRANGPFVKVNCGALPDTLLESELFGHLKGAFTGADRNKPGRFRMAHGGSLFLTEIGDLSLALQVKLLSFLDDRVVYPLGGNTGQEVDVRIIAATHRDLEAMAREGRFRRDLLFRLNVVRVHLPPLRERDRDVQLLRKHFLKVFCERFNKTVKGFSEEAARVLDHYPFPGNVRELRNIVEYAVNFCQTEGIRLEDLPEYILDQGPAPAEVQGPFDAAGRLPERSAAGSPGRGRETWAEAERRMIVEALMRSKGRKGRAAELLGWGRSTLWRKIRRHGIEG